MNVLSSLFVSLHLWLLDSVGRLGLAETQRAHIWTHFDSPTNRTLVLKKRSARLDVASIPLRSVEIADGLTSWEINL